MCRRHGRSGRWAYGGSDSWCLLISRLVSSRQGPVTACLAGKRAQRTLSQQRLEMSIAAVLLFNPGTLCVVFCLFRLLQTGRVSQSFMYLFFQVNIRFILFQERSGTSSFVWNRVKVVDLLGSI